jgi:hypothetical protein
VVDTQFTHLHHLELLSHKNMAHFAKVLNGVVTQVIVAEPEFLQSFVDSSPGEWLQTSYNTRGGMHSNGGTPLRKNYAGVGYIYDSKLDAFYEPQPFPSWILNKETCIWEAPTPYPSDGKQYSWVDPIGWIETNIQSSDS